LKFTKPCQKGSKNEIYLQEIYQSSARTAKEDKAGPAAKTAKEDKPKSTENKKKSK
jgi:hypothetical protein